MAGDPHGVQAMGAREWQEQPHTAGGEVSTTKGFFHAVGKMSTIHLKRGRASGTKIDLASDRAMMVPYAHLEVIGWHPSLDRIGRIAPNKYELKIAIDQHSRIQKLVRLDLHHDSSARIALAIDSLDNVSSRIASRVLKRPTRVRRSCVRYPPTFKTSPKSRATERMYVPRPQSI